jgi:phosphoglycolate phosphatase-like HAD superfamily hydrolase
MMESSAKEKLYAFEPRHSFFVGIDSDGSVFDTMEIKQKECFIPNIIKYWKLQAISKYACAAAEFVNLYSKWRGINRFPALTKTIELLRDWPEAIWSGAAIPDLTSLQTWIDSGAALGNPALEAEVSKTGDPVLKQALEWSKAVNRSIADRVKGVPPFPWFRACAERLAPRADIICVSVASGEALEREWREHDIAKYAAVLAGQEMGCKKDHLRIAAGSKYAKDCVLMIGDAPGDLAAARASGALFFPINPGCEEQSWERFYREGLERFFSKTYAVGYEAALVKEFEKLLPETPPWKRAVGRSADGQVGRSADGQVGRSADGQVGRSADGQVGSWRRKPVSSKH